MGVVLGTNRVIYMVLRTDAWKCKNAAGVNFAWVDRNRAMVEFPRNVRFCVCVTVVGYWEVYRYFFSRENIQNITVPVPAAEGEDQTTGAGADVASP